MSIFDEYLRVAKELVTTQDKLRKAEHDRDRYAKRIRFLQARTNAPANRILSLDEVKAHCEDEYMLPLWLESDLYAFNRYMGYDFMRSFLKSDYAIEMYGKTWRAWERTPTEGQRKMMQWESD